MNGRRVNKKVKEMGLLLDDASVSLQQHREIHVLGADLSEIVLRVFSVIRNPLRTRRCRDHLPLDITRYCFVKMFERKI